MLYFFFIALAPDSVHEVIDTIHGNSEVPRGNSEGGVIPADGKTKIIVGTADPVVVNRKNSDSKRAQSTPHNESEMLDWLKANKYNVAQEQGFYRISWHYRKPFTSKSNAIIISRDGTVSIRHEQPVVVYENGAIVIGERNVDIKGSDCILIGRLNGSIRRNGFNISSVSMKYRNGYHWVEFKRSFDWFLGNSIEDVWSKAKKIKEINE